MDNKDATEPERKDVTVTVPTAEAVATANVPEVKIELDRIAQILEGTNRNLRLTWIGIFIAIIIFLINMGLQYFKIL